MDKQANEEELKKREEILKQFPESLRKMYETSKQRARPRPPTRYADQTHIAPLVSRVSPNTVKGRPAIPKDAAHRVKIENFIHKVEADPNKTTGKTVIANDKLIIENWEAYYELVKDNAELKTQEEILRFVELVDSIPRACGCSRGALRESAQALYARMLPILEARDANMFNTVKQAKNVSKITFKDGDVMLLEV